MDWIPLALLNGARFWRQFLNPDTGPLNGPARYMLVMPPQHQSAYRFTGEYQ